MGLENGKEFYDKATRPKRAVLERLREEVVVKPQQPNEFTISEVADEFNLEYKTAQYRVKRLEREGKVSSRKPGKERYYRFVE